MRRISVFLIILLLSSALMAAGPEVSGRVKLFTSLFLQENLSGQYFSHKSGEFAYKRLEARLKFSGDLSDKVSYYLRFDAFSLPDALFTQSTFPESSLLGAPSAAEPFELSLYEGYVKISDFLLTGLDFTVGKQRIQWGTADKVNVVDNLNPVDFANFFTFDPDYFGERRPQTAFNLEYYIGSSSKVQLVWLLSRQHSPLPAGFSLLLRSGSFIPTNLFIETERPLMENTNFAARFSTVVFNTDVAVSYYRGNFSLPVLYGVDSSKAVSMDLYYFYPRTEVLGLELSGEIASVGFWAELACFLPSDEKAFLSFVVPLQSGLILTTEFPLFEKNYFKYVIGADYTFNVGTGLYVNLQYLHGFFDERDYSGEAEKYFKIGKGQFFGELEDYIIGRAEYRMLQEDLKLTMGVILEISGDANAVVYTPTLEYRAADQVVFQIGGFLAAGDEEGTKFGRFKKDKLLYFLVKLDF